MRVTAALACAACAWEWTGAASAAAPADSTACLALLSSDRHNDALALREMSARDPWPEVAARAGRNLAYLEDSVGVQCERGGWQWGLLARSHATAVVDAQALTLGAQVDAGQRPAADSTWAVRAHWRGFSGAALALGRAGSPAPGWTLQGQAQLLGLAQWRERRIDGPVQFSANSGSYTFDLQSQETSSRLVFPFAQPYGTRGLGLLFAGQAGWDGPRAWLQAGLRDGGWLRWRGIPQQQAVLSTSTRTVDADGFLVYRPLIEGLDSQAGLQRSLPPTLTLAGGWHGDSGQRAGLLLDRLPDYGVLPRLQWQQAAAAPGALAWRAEWRLHERRADVQLDWQAWTLAAGADRFGRSAHSRLLALSWRLPFGPRHGP